MIEDVTKDARQRMNASIESLKSQFAKVRTGRANAGLLDHVMVKYYDADTPLNQVATVNVEDSRTLAVTPWEKRLVPDIEKAIMKAGLGLNPVTSGEVVRVPLPAMTEERRKEMVKTVRAEAEGARVGVRGARRDANASLKAMMKDESLSKDDERRGETEVQKLTDDFVAKIDAILAEKEEELMAV